MSQITAASAGFAGDDTAHHTALYSKVTWRLIPLLFLCYVAAYLDRVNVGFAKLQMLGDLHFSSTAYGLGAGIFFIGYFIFEVPSNIILHRIGARVWIARIMITWAVISAAMIFVTTPTIFYVLRFFLGAAEAGLFPGIILYLTYWYPTARRGRVIGLFMTGIPIAGVIGAPLSGLIMQRLSGVFHLAGWQWMFLIEAVPSLIMGAAILLTLGNGIDDAHWLSDAEKALLARNVARDQEGAQSHTMRHGFTNPRVWQLCGIYFFVIIGLYGVGFWLPTLVKGAGFHTPLSIGLITALPYAVAALGMVVVSRLSDAKRERRWHIVIPAVVGCLGWLVSIRYATDPVIAIAALTVATTGVLVVLSQFWCLPTALLAGGAAATGVAVVNSVGNLSGFAGPFFIGWLVDRTHSTVFGVYFLAAAILIAGLLALTMPKRLVNR